MFRLALVLIFCFLSIKNAHTQTNDINDIQLGVALKATIDFNAQYPNFNIALSAGIGTHPFDFPEAYPTIHAGFLLYNKGDLVSSYKKTFFNSTALDLFLSCSMSVGFYTPNTNFNKRFVPLYYFADFTPSPLQNPFQHAFTFGTNIIWLLQQHEIPQRVGFTGIMIDRRLQANTYNDGSVWGKLKLGDKLDRYYTGGGMLSYHVNTETYINTIEFSFHKFTGHEKYAFDIANQLQIDFIPFKNEESYYYNKNRFRLTVTSVKNNFGMHVTAHNIDRDPQDWIHFKGANTYHPDIFEEEKGLWNDLRRAGIGAFWLSTHLNFTN